MVYSIYQQTWMQGQYEFSSTDSATLYSIATQTAADAGEAVYAARVMLDLEVDESVVSGQRLAPAPESTNEDPTQQVKLYPNPVNNTVNGSVSLKEGEQAIISITDLQGKVVLIQVVTGTFTIDVSSLETGLYLVQTSVDGALIETEKLEVIHE